ncbi:MAG: hypothetical protein GY772_03280 [bacterium]|nr:hypothetical protein [bacterium]
MYAVACDASIDAAALIEFTAIMLGRPWRHVQLLYLHVPMLHTARISEQTLPTDTQVYVEARASADAPFRPVDQLPVRPADLGPLEVSDDGVYFFADFNGWTLVAGRVVRLRDDQRPPTDEQLTVPVPWRWMRPFRLRPPPTSLPPGACPLGWTLGYRGGEADEQHRAPLASAENAGPRWWCWLGLHGLRSPPVCVVACDASARGRTLMRYVAMLIDRAPENVRLLYLNIPVRRGFSLAAQVIPTQAQALVEIRASVIAPWRPIGALPSRPAPSCPLCPSEHGVITLPDRNARTVVIGSIMASPTLTPPLPPAAPLPLPMSPLPWPSSDQRPLPSLPPPPLLAPELPPPEPGSHDSATGRRIGEADNPAPCAPAATAARE